MLATNLDRESGSPPLVQVLVISLKAHASAEKLLALWCRPNLAACRDLTSGRESRRRSRVQAILA